MLRVCSSSRCSRPRESGDIPAETRLLVEGSVSTTEQYCSLMADNDCEDELAHVMLRHFTRMLM